ncbi:MAG: hypothetical protein AABX11_02805 [Nanoarchaeota archaeon]
MIKKLLDYLSGLLVLGEGFRAPEISGIPLEEIRKYDLSQLNLVLPNLINDFRGQPFIESELMYPKLALALSRYEDLTSGMYVQINSKTRKIEWPTPEELTILDRLKSKLEDKLNGN